MKIVSFAVCFLLFSLTVQAGGEAGPIRLRDQGFFYVGIRQFKIPANPAAGPLGAEGVGIYGQMYVGFQLPENRTQKYPLILVHGGGGQATDYMGTPDGRDGLLDYFLAAGFDVYFVDRPGYGRSPTNKKYGEQEDSTSSGFISFLANSDRYPGNHTPTDPMILNHLASSYPGPTADNVMLKEDFAELLERVGPAIIITQSGGGPAGWVAIDAKPALVKALVAVEASGNFNQLPLTWEPPLKKDESIELVSVPSTGKGLSACNMQPVNNVHTLPHYKGIPVLGILSPQSPMFTHTYHCTVNFINQAGGSATLLRLKEDKGIEGNGHLMQEEYNNGEIAEIMIKWMEGIK